MNEWMENKRKEFDALPEGSDNADVDDPRRSHVVGHLAK